MDQRSEIIAIGGGGFTNAADPVLDDFVLSRCPPSLRRIGYVGLASDNDPVKLARFYDRLAGTGLAASHLDAHWSRHDAGIWLRAQGLVYFGGGNTARLVHMLRATGLDRDLADANCDGTVLAGVSAGGACWFESVLSDSTGAGLAPLAGLGLVAGSCCPHYSTEPGRRPAYEAAITAGAMFPGIAIDDGVAVVISGGVMRAFSARPAAWAYRVTRGEAATGTVSWRLTAVAP